jgi:hypothetical protein
VSPPQRAVLDLQRAAGNRATTQLVDAPSVERDPPAFVSRADPLPAHPELKQALTPGQYKGLWAPGGRRSVPADSGIASVIICGAQEAPEGIRSAPIEDDATWTRAGGLVFDPTGWARSCWTNPASRTFTGTVQLWEAWSGLDLSGDGADIVADAMAALEGDHAADPGTCVQPIIGVRHR